MRIVLAHDFGKQTDFATDVLGATSNQSLQIGLAERYALGTSYHAQAEKIYERLSKLRQHHPDAEIGFVADATGVGGPALEIVERSGALRLCDTYFAVVFTGGDQIRLGKRACDLSVPKTTLVRNAQAALAGGYLQLPPDAAHLKYELQRFVFKPSKKLGRFKAEAKDARTHDDLVSGLLLCVFGLQVDWAELMRKR